MSDNFWILQNEDFRFLFSSLLVEKDIVCPITAVSNPSLIPLTFRHNG